MPNKKKNTNLNPLQNQPQSSRALGLLTVASTTATLVLVGRTLNSLLLAMAHPLNLHSMEFTVFGLLPFLPLSRAVLASRRINLSLSGLLPLHSRVFL
jgi:hypothetical protein